MSKAEAVRRIKAILLEHEEDLSDGYSYYCLDDVDGELTQIAEEIVEACQDGS